MAEAIAVLLFVVLIGLVFGLKWYGLHWYEPSSAGEDERSEE
ncbi:hypothetical protein [Natrarchaeobaculum sulfurireducens]|nr:hypothetical protein [Natrarchaeobaculum sulfurireducens]